MKKGIILILIGIIIGSIYTYQQVMYRQDFNTISPEWVLFCEKVKLASDKITCANSLLNQEMPPISPNQAKAIANEVGGGHQILDALIAKIGIIEQ